MTKHLSCGKQRHRHRTQGVRRPDKGVSLRAATFNAALAPGFAPFVSERTPKVVEALAAAAEDLDVMCVQEFWQAEPFAMLRASVSSLPYALRMSPRPGVGSCSESEFLPLAGCLSQNCGEVGAEDVVGCAVSACGAEVASLSGGCLGCVMNQLDDLTQCIGAGGEPSDPAIFGGAFDTGLLSRWPIKRSSSQELTSYFVRASVQYARIDVPGIGFVDTFCTHLGSPLGIVAYAGSHGSWEQEQRQQIAELIEFVRKEHRGSHPVVVLGDFNMGPATANTEPIWPSNYRMMLDAGFDDAYTSQAEPLCTFCSNTSFSEPGASDQLIDHVFSAGLSLKGADVERLFLDPVELGNGVPPFQLSDHYGVKVTFNSVK